MNDPPSFTQSSMLARSVTQHCAIAVLVTFIPFSPASAATRMSNPWNMLCEDVLSPPLRGEAHALAFGKLAAPQFKFDAPIWLRLPAMSNCT
jgi:hypothetical protein